MATRKNPRPLSTGELLARTPGCFVYRAYGFMGELLYVGVTENLFQRLAAHSSGPWWRSAHRIEWEEFAGRDEALRVESKYIATLDPHWNIIGRVG